MVLACPHLSHLIPSFLSLPPALLLHSPLACFYPALSLSLSSRVFALTLTLSPVSSPFSTCYTGRPVPALIRPHPLVLHISLSLSLSLTHSLGGIEEWFVRTHSHFPSMCRASETPVCPQHLGQLCQGRSGVWVCVMCICECVGMHKSVC